MDNQCNTKKDTDEINEGQIDLGLNDDDDDDDNDKDDSDKK